MVCQWSRDYNLAPRIAPTLNYSRPGFLPPRPGFLPASSFPSLMISLEPFLMRTLRHFYFPATGCDNGSAFRAARRQLGRT